MGKYENLFTFLDDLVVCNSCKWVVKKPSNHSTSLLRYHLKTRHKETMKTVDAITETNKKRKREVVKSNTSTPNKDVTPKKPKLEQNLNIQDALTIWNAEELLTTKAERALMQFICCSTLPISIVESEGLRNFVSVICPRFNIKSRTFYTLSVLNSLYQEYKCKVIDMLSTATSISFTTDYWSSEDNKHSLQSLTAHFVDSSMCPRFAVIAAASIKGRHTADNLKSLWARAMAAFDIDEEKVHLIVRDAASTMRRTTNLLGMKSADCFAHKLQLVRAVNDGLKALGVSEPGDNSIVSRLLKIVKKIRKSAVDKDALLECQNICEIPESSLVKGMEIRWNTMYDMLQRFLDNRKAIELFLVDRADYPQLDTYDWALMKKLVDILKPLAVATKFVQHREYAPISVVIPLYKVILRQLDSSTKCSVKEAIAEGLKRRMEDEGYEETEEFVIATMVDPRFKDSYFDSDKQVVLLKKLEELASQQVMRNVSPASEDIDDDNGNPFLKYSHESPLTSISPTHVSVDAKAKAFAEMEEYLSKEPTFKVDPFEFWRSEDNAAKYPLMKLLAKRYLSAPATSAESGRLFSAAGLVVGDLRRSLSPENLEKLLDELIKHYVMESKEESSQLITDLTPSARMDAAALRLSRISSTRAK
ncbi:unnamed protein product [Nippostrongylus brasiliensis]|uniref:Dimer_Tnp_hAT domain-containing protein n=1 Tax=Nippostrongylus brasiliensis TaxID=27835 RepID=A0A0N4XX22_NIPBR|nr:unnamed protein product [Nippostrongylus brasiliensis]